MIDASLTSASPCGCVLAFNDMMKLCLGVGSCLLAGCSMAKTEFHRLGMLGGFEPGFRKSDFFAMLLLGLRVARRSHRLYNPGWGLVMGCSLGNAPGGPSLLSACELE